MDGGGWGATIWVAFVMMAIAFSPVLTESKSSSRLDRVGLGSQAAKGKAYDNTSFAPKYPFNRGGTFNHEKMFSDHVSDRKLATKFGRDLESVPTESVQKVAGSDMIIGSEAEVEALAAFRAGIVSDSLGALSSWNTSDSSACSWHAVTCASSSNRVVSLDLGNLELEGPIAPQLGNLQLLETLNLSSNNFFGEIPESLLNCSNLLHLALGGNNLSGQAPAELGELRNLQSLDLSSNAFLGGTIPASIGNCSSLRLLLLSSTGIQGEIPYSLGQLTRLEILDLSATSLSGTVPTSLGNCSSLTHLSMGNHFLINSRGLTGELPKELGNLVRLTSIIVDGSNIAGPLSGWIANLTSLTTLGLGYSSFTGEIPGFLGQLPLGNLDLEDNYLSGPIPAALANCSQLWFIAIGGNALNGPLPPDIGMLNHLTALSLSPNNLSGHIPSLANLSRLTTLQLGDNPFNPQPFPPWIPSLVNLNILFLSNMHLHGNMPPDIGKLSNLQYARVNYNNLNGKIPKSVGNCTSLLDLELGINQLSGELPSEIFLLTELQTFVLFNNSITGALPASISNWSELVKLDCGYNNFTGVIPPQIATLQYLNYLDFVGNDLGGHVPPFLGNSTGLGYVGLSNNQLVGSIPASIGNLTNLQELTLQGNRLQGEIPADLTRCTLLGILHLSDNSLTGSIPEGIGQLNSLGSLYLNNNNLSGALPQSLGSCSELAYVDLSYNALEGVFPPALLPNLSSGLVSWNMSHNLLTGSLPANLGALQDVYYLDFSHNNFSGSVPQSLGECKSLLSLDLSVNGFTGAIPQTLAELSQLTFLNVSNNQLNGPIPAGGIFGSKNLTGASFFGNAGLCGGVLGRECPALGHSPCRGFQCKGLLIFTVGILSASLIFGLVLLAFGIRSYRSRRYCIRSGDYVAVSFERGLKLSKDDILAYMRWPENVIGAGARSTVYKGMLKGGRNVALKTFRIEVDVSEDISKEVEADILREAHILAKLRHRNILKVLGAICSHEIVALVLEFLPNGSLSDHLYPGSPGDASHKLGCLNWDTRLNIALGVAHGLVYLHSELREPVIHRDLKPCNIFLDENLEPKLGDFGLSRFANPDREGEKTVSSYCGTIGYIAPEYAVTTLASTKGDVYSFGVVLLELLARKHPILEDDSVSGESKHLADWALESFLQDTPLVFLDEKLIEESVNREDQRNQMELLIRVGVLCTRKEPQNRPNMTDVLAMLKHIMDEEGYAPIGPPSVGKLACLISPLTSARITPVNSGRVTPLNSGRVTPLNSGRVTPLNCGRVTPLNSCRVTPLDREESCRFEYSSQSQY